jgi:hypothetical protein
MIRGLFRNMDFKWLLLLLLAALVLPGCAGAPKGFDPGIKGPQMVADPCTVRRGVVNMLKTPLVFRGQGFQPEDSVFVTLMGVKKGDKVVDIPIADAEVDKAGSFTAKVGTIAKVSELLNAKLGSNAKMENIIVVSGPPIPAGVYTVRAVSMESDKKAECRLKVAGPFFGDVFKDWIGRVTGKIVDKTAK